MTFRNTFWGVMLIVAGSMFLIEELSSIDFGRYFWPVILIVSGVLLLFRHTFSTDKSTHSNY
ncbi:LiaI-LiaF-like domain-containing protein [Telluribacter sp. SYSU D00476]|uniref:LiaI-LiaF-like domain-containing protein n=1 Tax=Telluribacter sp. SYSU D00476 TaxID=2811430 RepID=UPI001FF5E68B|nr:DUF5668 domain-containing protein [Telluribacter sp. SYSU D00476]